MTRIRRFLRIAAVTGVLAAGGTTLSVPAGAQTAQQLSAGQVTTLQDPGIALTAPGDGRLNSYGAAVRVEGVAFTQRAGAGSCRPVQCISSSQTGNSSPPP